MINRSFLNTINNLSTFSIFSWLCSKENRRDGNWQWKIQKEKRRVRQREVKIKCHLGVICHTFYFFFLSASSRCFCLQMMIMKPWKFLQLLFFHFSFFYFLLSAKKCSIFSHIFSMSFSADAFYSGCSVVVFNIKAASGVFNHDMSWTEKYCENGRA